LFSLSFYTIIPLFYLIFHRPCSLLVYLNFLPQPIHFASPPILLIWTYLLCVSEFSTVLWQFFEILIQRCMDLSVCLPVRPLFKIQAQILADRLTARFALNSATTGCHWMTPYLIQIGMFPLFLRSTDWHSLLKIKANLSLYLIKHRAMKKYEGVGV
jgi:hypothetical protein